MRRAQFYECINALVRESVCVDEVNGLLAWPSRLGLGWSLKMYEEDACSMLNMSEGHDSQVSGG